MHILLIHQAFATLDEPGGTRHHEMARYLVKQGHEITIIASSISYLTGKPKQHMSHWVEKTQVEPGITIFRAYTYPALHRSFIHRVFSFLSFMISSFIVGIRVKHVDLVWGTSPPIFQGITAWLLARLKQIPFLFEVRDLWPAFAIAVGVLRHPILIRSSQWLEIFLYTHADQVIINSPGYLDLVKQKGARDVEIIPNGVDPTMFDPEADGNPIREQYGWEGKFIALYAGAHGLSNDLDVVLNAALFLKEITQIHFVFVGDGKEKSRLQSRATELGLINVTFLPPVRKMDINKILAAADACIAILKPLELYKTTYPNKVFDYMAAGRPVILAIEGVIQKVIEEAQAGIPVQPGNPEKLAAAIKYLVDHDAARHQMGISGRRFVEMHFNRSQQAQKLLHLLLKMRSRK